MKQTIGFVQKHAANFIFVFALVWVGSRQAPAIIEAYRRTDQAAVPMELTTTSGELIQVPSLGKPLAVVFWATWCPPCQVELDRIHQLVVDGSISAEQVIAISSGEDVDLVQRHVQEKQWKFKVVSDPSAVQASKYGISATPTTLLITEQGRIDWYGTGISPLLTWRLKRFL